MKKALLLFALIVPLAVFSQKKKSIDGFLNIPFGSDSITVKTTLLAKGAKRIDSLSKKDIITFTGFDFSGRNTSACTIRFVDNKAYQCDIAFIDFKESDILAYYDSLAADVSSVYGDGQLENNFGDAKDPLKILRLRTGAAFCHTVWQSKNKNTIEMKFVSVDRQFLEIVLDYQSSSLWDLNAAKRRSDL